MSEELSPELLKGVFMTALDAAVITDRDTSRILDVNHAACALYGYTREEMLHLEAEDLAAHPEATAQALAAGTVWPPNHLHRRRDGSLFPAEVADSDFEVNGRWVRVGHTRDISVRVAAEVELAEAIAKYRAALETFPDAVTINRMRDGLFIEVNEGFTSITGHTREDVYGKTSNEIMLWSDPADRTRLVDGLIRDGAVTNLEADFRFKDGIVRRALMSARTLPLAGEACLMTVTRDISSNKEAEAALVESNAKLEQMVRDVAEAMGRIVESRDPYTQGHQERVAEVSVLIGREMGLSDRDLDAIEMAALVHDVGKLAVPAEILNKPGRLSKLEFSLIQVHSEQGHAILRDIDLGAPVASIVLQHHERMDGSGYPSGLKGDEILPAARILSVADLVEAMASYRPYRPAVGLVPAIDELSAHPEKYDPEVVSACRVLFERGDLGFLTTSRGQ